MDSEDTEEPTTKDSEEPTTKDSEEPTIKDSEDSTTKDSEEPTTKDSEVQEEKEIGKSIVCAMECIIKSYSTNPVLSWCLVDQYNYIIIVIHIHHDFD